MIKRTFMIEKKSDRKGRKKSRRRKKDKPVAIELRMNIPKRGPHTLKIVT